MSKYWDFRLKAAECISIQMYNSNVLIEARQYRRSKYVTKPSLLLVLI